MIAERLTAQLLAGTPSPNPIPAVKRLLAVQAQDPRAARLAVRARTAGLSAADVDRGLTVDRSLVIGWLNRGTLHLVCAEDYHWLHALTAPALFTANARRLAQEGVEPRAAERGVAVIARSLGEDGPLTRVQLGERIARAGVRTDGQALVHLLMRASLQGLAVRGPLIGREHAYALVADWLGERGDVDHDIALVELALRYLAGHGPADERDLAKWAGLKLRDARFGLNAIASELDRRSDGLVDLLGREPAAPMPPPRLLGAFDPLLMGWTSRIPITGRHDSRVVGGGTFRPIALIGGRAAATWKLQGRRVELEPFGRLKAADADALQIESEDVVRYLHA